jgi:hypothetical protein
MTASSRRRPACGSLTAPAASAQEYACPDPAGTWLHQQIPNALHARGLGLGVVKHDEQVSRDLQQPRQRLVLVARPQPPRYPAGPAEPRHQVLGEPCLALSPRAYAQPDANRLTPGGPGQEVGRFAFAPAERDNREIASEQETRGCLVRQLVGRDE